MIKKSRWRFRHAAVWNRRLRRGCRSRVSGKNAGHVEANRSSWDGRWMVSFSPWFWMLVIGRRRQHTTIFWGSQRASRLLSSELNLIITTISCCRHWSNPISQGKSRNRRLPNNFNTEHHAWPRAAPDNFQSWPSSEAIHPRYLKSFPNCTHVRF